MKKIIYTIFAAAFISAIIAALGTVAVASPSKLSQKQIEECVRKGGRVDYVGLLGNEICRLPYSDGGKSCRNSSECLGGCLPDQTATNFADFSRRVQKGLEVPGRCAAETQSGFGCGGTIENGRLKSTGMCVD